MKNFKKLILLIAIFISTIAFSQQVGVTVLRQDCITTAQRNTIVVPVGAQWKICNSDTGKNEFWNGTSWEETVAASGLPTEFINGDGTLNNFITVTQAVDLDVMESTIENLPISNLADGTDGELITWDAAGVPSTVPVGTAGQRLTSNGVGAEPTFQDVDGGSETIIVIKVSDESMSSTTTPTFDSELTTSVDASSSYTFEIFIFLDSASNTPDWKGFPDCTSLSNGRWGIIPTLLTNFIPTQLVIEVDAAIKGYLLTGSFTTSGSGTFGLKWSQNVSNANATKTRKFSYLKITKL